MTRNEYIVANAEHGGDEKFLSVFGDTDVYFPIVSPSDQLKPGPLTASLDVEIKLQFAKFDIGDMALFYVSKSDARLSERFGGMPLTRAAEMVCAMPDVDGMLIQSDGDAGFVARKDALRDVLGSRRA